MAKTSKQIKQSAPYVSADTFLRSIDPNQYQFDNIQASAFKVRMRVLGKYYQPTLDDFVPYFEQYLGIKKAGN